MRKWITHFLIFRQFITHIPQKLDLLILYSPVQRHTQPMGLKCAMILFAIFIDFLLLIYFSFTNCSARLAFLRITAVSEGFS